MVQLFGSYWKCHGHPRKGLLALQTGSGRRTDQSQTGIGDDLRKVPVCGGSCLN